MADLTVREFQRAMFPRRFRPERMGRKPLYRADDEWGRHTLTAGVPFLWGVTLAYKWCDDSDMLEFRCTFPGCPANALSNHEGRKCVTHDEELNEAVWAEVSTLERIRGRKAG
jgi:hypothetical protein